jgi:dolichol kinase
MEKEVEIRRKGVHLVLGLLVATMVFYGYLDVYIIGVSTIIVFLILSMSWHFKFRLTEWIFRNFERSEERKRFPGKGALFYLLGIELSLLLFPDDIALAAIVILAIGDSIPNIVGMYFKKVRHPFSNKKFLEGTIIGIVLGALAAHIFVIWYEALLASIIAIFVEGIDLKFHDKIDDNLTVPLIASLVIASIRWVIQNLPVI